METYEVCDILFRCLRVLTLCLSRHACGNELSPDVYPETDRLSGENPIRDYSLTRMDIAWNFRSAYESARKIRDAQDQFCSKAEAGAWCELGDFPEDIQWEALVDVLRGKVKLSVHCYEACVNLLKEPFVANPTCRPWIWI